MKKLLCTVVRAAAVAAMVSQSTGAADLALTMGPAARPGLFPAPARFSPGPKPLDRSPDAAGKSSSYLRQWLSDAQSVALWIGQQWDAPAPTPLRPAALVAAADVPEPLSFSAAPGQPIAEDKIIAPEDRILLVKDKEIVGIAAFSARLDAQLDIDYHPPVYQKRFSGAWFERGSLRFRITYLNDYGVTEGRPNGFKLLLSGSQPQFFPSKVPQAFYHAYPVYFHHDRVTAEVELENTGTEMIDNISVNARQEIFDQQGKAGCPVTPAMSAGSVKSLAPGAKAVIRYAFPLEGPTRENVNFEQTHLIIAGSGEVLADEPQVGVVDPPKLTP
jgi:hypothetical protein